MTNSGSLATNGPVVVTPTLPAGLKLRAYTGNTAGWSCTTLTVCTYSDTLAAGASSTFRIYVTVDSETAANVTTTAAITSGGGGCPGGTGCTASVDTRVGLACGALVYRNDAGGNLYSTPTDWTTSGATVNTLYTTVPTTIPVGAGNVSGAVAALEALGISADGARLYLTGTVGGVSSVLVYDVAATPQWSAYTTGASVATADRVSGAVGPDGRYYFGGSALGAAIYLFNPANPTAGAVRIGSSPGGSGGSGDYAFSAGGDLYIQNNLIFTVIQASSLQAAVASPSTSTIPGTEVNRSVSPAATASPSTRTARSSATPQPARRSISTTPTPAPSSRPGRARSRRTTWPAATSRRRSACASRSPRGTRPVTR